MSEKYVRLYTRQNDKTLYALEHKGRIINEKRYVELHFGPDAELFLESYDWFTKEASKDSQNRRMFLRRFGAPSVRSDV